MKLKNKIRRQLMSIKTEKSVKIGDEIKYNDNVIGKILIDKPYPFALIKLFDPEFSVFKDETLKINNDNAEILSWKKSIKTLIGPVKILGKSVQKIHFGVYLDVL